MCCVCLRASWVRWVAGLSWSRTVEIEWEVEEEEGAVEGGSEGLYGGGVGGN